MRKAYSKGFEFRSQFSCTCSSLPSGSESGIGQQPPDNRALAVVHVPGNHNIHFLFFSISSYQSFYSAEFLFNSREFSADRAV